MGLSSSFNDMRDFIRKQPQAVFRWALVLVGGLSAVCLAGAADSRPVASQPVERVSTTPAVEPLDSRSADAIGRALDWLAEHQRPDGGWQGTSGGNTGVAAFAVMAFMSVGDLPQAGRYGPVAEKGIEYVLRNAQPDGLIVNPADTSKGFMYEHALATLLLAEALGEYERPGLRDTLKRAVDLIVRTQNEEGGWRYEPVPRDADISVTVTQIVALRAASHAGIALPKRTVDAAVRYVKRCAAPGGGFLYQIGVGEPAYARSAAGACALLIAGEYEAAETAAAIQYLLKFKPVQLRDEPHLHYGLYYAAQAMYLYLDREQWKRWYPPIRDEVLAMQEPDGRWDGEAGPTYGTAVSILVLTVPHRYMPVYQR